MHRPRIGLTTWRRSFDAATDTSPDKVTLGHGYVDAVVAGGGLPLLLPSLVDAETVEQVLDTLDGVVLTGGGDVCPVAYGDSNEGKSVGVDTDRDAFETLLAQGAHARNMPVLGICRGLQIINVAFGGSLQQHVTGDRAPTINANHPRVYKTPAPEMLERRHAVHFAEGSALEALYGDSVVTNSLHHQAVDQLAPGFVAVGHAEDGIVEALESADGSRDIVAVQWHPEKVRDEGGDELIGWFVERVRSAVTVA